jgi:hypothetical protein
MQIMIVEIKLERAGPRSIRALYYTAQGPGGALRVADIRTSSDTPDGMAAVFARRTATYMRDDVKITAPWDIAFGRARKLVGRLEKAVAQAPANEG